MVCPASAEAAGPEPRPVAACVEQRDGSRIAAFDAVAARRTQCDAASPSAAPLKTSSQTPRMSAPDGIGPLTTLTEHAFSPASFWNATIPSTVAFATGTIAVRTASKRTAYKRVNPTVGQELAAFA